LLSPRGRAGADLPQDEEKQAMCQHMRQVECNRAGQETAIQQRFRHDVPKD